MTEEELERICDDFGYGIDKHCDGPQCVYFFDDIETGKYMGVIWGTQLKAIAPAEFIQDNLLLGQK